MFNFQIITDILRNINITLAAILKQFSNLASNSLCFSFSRLVSEVPKEQKTNMKQHRKKKLLFMETNMKNILEFRKDLKT